MTKRILVTVAHPDDEVFGPGGTITKYASEGAEVHILSATRGESGQWDENQKSQIPNPKSGKEIKLHHVREEELRNSAKILGAAKVEFLGFVDGHLCNNDYQKIASKIIRKINGFKPQVIITMDRLGVSGHIDHITVSLTTTYAFLHTEIPKKLYYEVMRDIDRKNDKRLDEYFIYFPEGYSGKEITTRIDYSRYFEIKKKAMLEHRSQMKDVENILKSLERRNKTDYFILGKHRGIKTELPETDLFAGIDG